MSSSCARRATDQRALGYDVPGGPLLLRLVMGVRFLVVVVALAAEEEQNSLQVAGTHTASFRRWQVVVKRTIKAYVHR